MYVLIQVSKLTVRCDLILIFIFPVTLGNSTVRLTYDLVRQHFDAIRESYCTF